MKNRSRSSCRAWVSQLIPATVLWQPVSRMRYILVSSTSTGKAWRAAFGALLIVNAIASSCLRLGCFGATLSLAGAARVPMEEPLNSVASRSSTVTHTHGGSDRSQTPDTTGPLEGPDGSGKKALHYATRLDSLESQRRQRPKGRPLQRQLRRRERRLPQEPHARRRRSCRSRRTAVLA